jgi:hypothetical protein
MFPSTLWNYSLCGMLQFRPGLLSDLEGHTKSKKVLFILTNILCVRFREDILIIWFLIRFFWALTIDFKVIYDPVLGTKHNTQGLGKSYQLTTITWKFHYTPREEFVHSKSGIQSGYPSEALRKLISSITFKDDGVGSRWKIFNHSVIISSSKSRISII